MVSCRQPEDAMSSEGTKYDPLAHVPDPNDPIQVFAYRRGVEIYVEIREKDSTTGLTIPWLLAMKVPSQINEQLLYAIEGVLIETRDGTVPEFERLIDEWGPHGEGTAEQN
jgi:hypothetical protein